MYHNMEVSGPTKTTTTTTTALLNSTSNPPPLHTTKLLRRAAFNRLYIAVYSAALLALFYHHARVLSTPSTSTTTTTSFISTLLLLFSDLILAFQWVCIQSFHVRPIHRHEHLENLEKAIGKDEFPAVDIFICTADPHKEPPMGTVNTAVSVLAYDYPPEKVSVYVSDDGGSQLTLFALVEAAVFARHWLPFCRDNRVVERCPEAYYGSSSYVSSTEAEELKTMYDSMKVRVENAVEMGKVVEWPIIDDENDEEMHKTLAKWTHNFTRQDHPPIVQVLIASVKHKDMSGQLMPNLIYVSREKRKTHHHHFKAGALNTLLRVSATMTNAPIVLTLDCDTYSNDPTTIKRALCYFLDPITRPTLAYIQFPQIFRGLNRGDIYFSEHKRLFQIHPIGMDGLQGPNYVGTGCFFQRRAFFGGPSSFVRPKIQELSPNHTVRKPIGSPEVLALAHDVTACNFEDQTDWGAKLGFRYGSLVEDYYTGYRLQCEGWKAVFCHPERPAFWGDSPTTLIDLLGQCKRWIIGLLNVLCSRYNTLTYGISHMGLLMGLAYTHNSFWALYSIPFTLYAFIPQLALLNRVDTFPKVTDPWCIVYIFLFLGANAKDLLDFLLEKGTFERWWNSQRVWMICGLSSFLFGLIEYTLSSLGIGVHGFELTSKLQDEELNKRYDQGTYEFGVASPMFVPLTMAALINLISFISGLKGFFTRGVTGMEGLFLQTLLSGFVVVNCWPFYEAMVFRSDKGRMPTKITLVAALLVSILYIVGSLFVKI